MKQLLFIALVTGMIFSFGAAQAQTNPSTSTTITYHTTTVGGLNIFYREAGLPSRPAIVCLHGFPSSSHMYIGIIFASKGFVDFSHQCGRCAFHAVRSSGVMDECSAIGLGS